ncbi:MAG: NADH-ubiquinone oxidoreductase-F iron-sulfur binding region domain-containing protein [Dehalococcoidia bacterium]|nr:NADP-reducing hydrogenase subunit HndC [Chloroflexota bacterium]MBT9160640.1 NADP-reducing hydrogenase subunit HndC [Chloroflexota bacterium]MBT9162514.1 NADP-reducing hydrogenase subunit HndC [Chloroflexota bacterium]
MLNRRVLVCQGTGCISGGAEQILSSLEKEIARLNLRESIQIKRTGCHGLCQRGPLVVVEPEGIFYSKVSQDDMPELARSLLPEEKAVERLFYRDPATDKPIPCYRDIPFYSKQQRTVLRNCGNINPEDIDDYFAVDGYQALRKALFELAPEQTIDELKHSGLRGLGGAGFPTGRKWEACRRASGEEKYVICNADEGDPGAFQDRSLMEGDPHSVLEGMIIAAYAIGAKEGFIYVRAEYPLAVKRLRIALTQAKEKGFLGKDILGSGLDFDIVLFQGAGAFVCGESTALVLSIEGKRGVPKPFPRPRTAEVGLWDKPTLLNNVKTFANIPLIIAHGSEWFASRGTEHSKGTAIFSLTGKVANNGLIEVPMGITLREIIYDIGGGILEGKAFKAVQTGGPSGGCLPASLLDIAIDFDSLTTAGSMMGSGGMVVMDEDTCMVDVARYFFDFTRREACGQCIPCRLGTKQMFDILDDITKGQGRPEDIDLLWELGEAVGKGSLCALGQTAPNPVLTTIRYFRNEYEAHVYERRCPAGVCTALA